MFSSRTPGDLAPNPLAERLARLRAAGEPILDLTESNPTRAGFDYPGDRILAALASPAALRYEPDPKGLPEARRAVVGYYGARGVEVDPEQVVLTASTSEAYTLLFKIFCEPGDEVLVPVPSYPLFEHLARAEGVVPIPCPLALDGAWRFDASSLREAITPRTRAVVFVSPNNPTGTTLEGADRERLVAICAEYGLPLVCDEVFADYLDGERSFPTVAGERRALAFALSGLSKVACLPQLKLGWIVVGGPPRPRDEALARLEFAADLFLSVNTPVQAALGRLLELAPALQRQVRERVAANRRALEERVGRHPALHVVPARGGWYAMLRVPRVVAEEELVLELLERDRVLVHPGYFFDLPTEGWLVLSLLPREAEFAEACNRLAARLASLF